MAVLPSAPAGAATASRVERCYKFDCVDYLDFAAGLGEANSVTVSVAQEAIVIRDLAALQAAAGCIQVDEHSVSCAPSRPGPVIQVRFDLRDGDDVLDARATPAFTRMYGGRGDDRLLGPLDDHGDFIGGPGDDRMAGGHRVDRFAEGTRANGSDTILAAGPDGRDFGADSVSYGRRRGAVHVDAQGDRDDGAPGERDRIVGVESVFGGLGDDVLIGGPGPDDLNGNHGRDLLRGGRGNDELSGGDPLSWYPESGPVPRTGDTIFGGPGFDRINGGLGPDSVNGGPGRDWIQTGGGADRIATRDGVMDTVFCGTGRPDAAVNDRLDFVESCERHGALPQFAIPLSWGGPPELLALVVACPRSATPTCEGRIVIKREETVIGEVPFSMRADSHGYIHVPTPGRSDQDPGALADATVTIVSTTASGDSSEDFALSDVCYGIRCPG
jgi:hemolysin type calcium-binding protein